MNSGRKIEEQFEEIRKLGQEDKSLDTAVLMMNAPQNQKQDLVELRQKRRAYLVSVLFPPFGLLYAVRYYFDARSDARRVALTCVALTVVILFLIWLMAQALFAGTGVDLQQIEQIKPSDIQQLLR